ncbi:putative reverse transcriptase domain-containing protein [Tanacetum coccineum]
MHQCRWIELFGDYDCEIHYHPGKVNVVAEALKASDEPAEMQQGMDELMERRSDGALYYLDRIWDPFKGDVRTLIMDEAYKSKYFVHPGADKMYYDLRDRYWWPRMKKDIDVYVSRCLTCLKVTTEHQRSSGLLQQPEILEWKWKRIAMDFVTKLPRTSSGHDIIWVIVDRLTKFAHFLPMREDYMMDRLKAARDRQQNYADKRRKPLEFNVGEYVLLKVSSWKGVVRFIKKGKLAPRLPEELNGVHDKFHVSNLEKCLDDPTLQVPLDEIQVDAKLNFVEEPLEILEREFKKLKRSRIAIVKVRWNSNRGPEFTWELEDQLRLKNLGTTLESKIIVRKLLNSVPKKFLPIVATIEQYQDLDEMSFEEAVGRLTAFEERIKSQDTLEANDQDKLLLASSNNQSHGKGRGKNFNKEAKESMKWKNSPNARGTSAGELKVASPRALVYVGVMTSTGRQCHGIWNVLHVFTVILHNYLQFEILAQLLGEVNDHLEVMVVLKNDVTAENVLNDSEHGLRRWLHKLRRDDNFQRLAERITWITILGVSVSYSGEAIFKKVTAMHGTILALHNCSLEGNQNIGYGRVYIHTIKKSLIREDLNVIVNGKVHKGDKEMQVDDEDDEEEKGDEDEEANSNEDSDEEEGGEAKVKYGDDNGPISATGGHFAREDEGSRFSSETRVGETFEVDSDSLKTKTYGEDERVYGEYNGNSFFNGLGNKCNNEDAINVEKQNNDLSLADGIKETNMGNKKRYDWNGTIMGDFRPGGEQMLDKSIGLDEKK